MLGPAACDLTRDCLVFLKDRQVSSFECFVFDFWVLRFRDLGAPFSIFGCFVFEFWVLRFRDLGAPFSQRCGSVETSDKVRILSHFSPSHEPLVILYLVLHFSEVWKCGVV